MNIRFTGIGGQGILITAYILGKAAIKENKNAIQTKSYGSAYRGTLCKSDVIISETEIYELEFQKTDILISLSEEGYSNYNNGIKKDGHLFYDKILVPIKNRNRNQHGLAAFNLSKQKFGSTIYGNIIMLGYMVGTRQIVSKESIIESIKETVPKSTIKKNISAFKIGYKESKK